MTFAKKLLGQTAVYGLSTILGRLLNYLLVPLYTYQFEDTAEYGIVGELYAYVSFLNILLTYGMETALFNFSSKEQNKERVYSTSLVSLLSSTLLFFVFFMLFADKIAAGLGYGDHVNYLQWIIVILATDALCAIPFAKLREQNRATRFAILKLLNIFINIAINLFFLWYCKNAYETDPGPGEGFALLYEPSIGIGYVFIANGVANIVTLLLLLPDYFRVSLRFDPALWKRMMRYAWPLIIVGFAGMINETLDRVLIKYLADEDAMGQVGVYSACYKIAILMTIFIQAFRYASEPFFFFYQKEQNSKQAYSVIMTWFVIACSAIFLGTMMNISWIQYFIGEEYRSGLHVVPILLLANLFLGIYYNLSIWYKLTGQTRYGAWITVFGAVITLGINLAFIPAFGYTAAAWATFACYGSMMIASWALGNKHFTVDYDLKRILGYLALSVALYLAGCLIPEDAGFWGLAGKNALFLLFISMVLFLEKNGIRSLARSLKK